MYRILDTFPNDPALVESSFTSALLRRLSSVIFAFPSDLFSTHTIREIGQHKVYVEDVLPVLAVLCSTDFSAAITTSPTFLSKSREPGYGNEESSGPGFFAHNKKQKNSRQKDRESTLIIDTTPFRKLGAKVPLSNTEAFQMACKIISNLKMGLTVRLRHFDPL